MTMREIDAHVKGFDYMTFHVYRTEVVVDAHTWTLDIRYTTFYQFYMRLLALEKHFPVDFPPKGGLFFSPPPEERQEQLDDFLLGTLAYFDMRGHPKRMGALLDELLQISEHLGVKENDDEDRTASEGSSEEHDDCFLESNQEDEHRSSPRPFATDVEVGSEEPVGALSANGSGEVTSKTVGLASGMSIGADIGQARGTTIATVAGKSTAALEGKGEEVDTRESHDEHSKRTEAEYPVVKWFRRLSTFSSGSVENDELESAEKKKRQEEEEAAAKARAEAEEAAAKVRAEVEEAAAKVRAEVEEAAAKACEKAEAKARAEAMKAELLRAVKAELLRAKQELNLRLTRYRHPVFFRNFVCDVGTSRYSFP
uniref:PX domain-containing protein n=1 Tax=Hyaloperonospora arabidopsidis (strain Emoy2) TaxID=559515 RepID=M4BSF9_HYAAE